MIISILMMLIKLGFTFANASSSSRSLKRPITFSLKLVDNHSHVPDEGISGLYGECPASSTSTGERGILLSEATHRELRIHRSNRDCQSQTTSSRTFAHAAASAGVCPDQFLIRTAFSKPAMISQRAPSTSSCLS
eukprot:Blabericola_migrator_1__8137@NODE_419_length_8686_cov_23_589744_g331_i0_p3_GENE_NODE_419_length_8686_cov_23_589744_g331_i0NODE_419_length_8686_cov_23_589744_g331_i0_p3_ORF_typecomplete_len135_score6_60SR1P/PF13790_6/0_36_NODE_419_length_8686_cov_23_589744_g331_i062316635